MILAANGQLQPALSAFERAARLAPRDADARYNLGLLRRRLGGSTRDERRDYRAALALDADLAEAHLALGCLLADPQTPVDVRDEAQARVHLERFLDLALPTDTEGLEQATAWLDWLAYRRGE
ncbi:MAG: hypothetical protein ACYTG6_07095 [Planctomycetota bacterium]